MAKFHDCGVEDGQKAAQPAFTVPCKGITICCSGINSKVCCAGALSVPLYRDVQGTGPWDRLKKVVMAGLVMRATGPVS